MPSHSLDLGVFLRDLVAWLANLWQIWIIMAGYAVASGVALYLSEGRDRNHARRLALTYALYVTVLMCVAYSENNYGPVSRIGRLLSVLNHVVGLFVVGIVVFIVTQSLL